MGKLKLILLITISIFLLLTTFNNCGKVQLRTQNLQADTGVIGSNQSRGTVPMPKPASGDLRAVFFIDNSNSMISGTCAGTVDYDALAVKPPPVDCIGSISGIDHDLKRVKIIRQWLGDIETAYASRPDLLAKVKMLILPFSGGYPQTALNGFFALPANLKFSSIAETNKVLDRIESMQNKLSGVAGLPIPDAVVGGMAGTSLQGYFGTSVPRPKILSSMAAIKLELELLKDNVGARFEYVFISDGVPKPRGVHVEKAAVKIWSSLVETRPTGRCLLPPGAPLYSPPSSNPIEFGCLQIEYETVGFDSCSNSTCKQAVRDWAELGSLTATQNQQCRECIDTLARIPQQPFFDAILSSWGNPMDNTPDAIFHTLGKIKAQQDQYADISFRFNFLRLDTLTPVNFATPREELSKDVNWLVKAKDVYKSGHRTLDVLTPQVDFGLFPGLSKNESYKLESIVALNITTRLNSAGVMDIDSDSDGLFDFEERQLNIAIADPVKARTNNVCLDSIVYQMGGCITMGCSADIDSDADGLNECEEKTLGTSDFDFDMDGDGIPDSMEILYGYNPMVSDRKVNSSVDQIDNYDQWKMGVPASLSVNSIPPEFLTQVIAEYQGQKTMIDSLNRTILVPEYLFQIQNIRTAAVGGSTDTPVTFMSKTRKPSTAINPRIIGGTHDRGINRIVVIGKVASVQNIGDAYWVGKVLDVPYEKEGQQVIINFDDLKPLQALDPQEGSR